MVMVRLFERPREEIKQGAAIMSSMFYQGLVK
jgi:hypothetical protein